MTTPGAAPGRWLGARGWWLVAFLGLLLALDPARLGTAPVDAEGTPWMMLESLRWDGDLVYEADDLERAVERWSAGPRGLRLSVADEGGRLSFADSPAYPLLMLPFYWLLGGAGVVLLQGLLLIWLMRSAEAELGRPFGTLFIGASALLLFAWLPQPHLLLMALLLYGTKVWMGEGGSWLVAGAGWAAAGVIAPVVLILPLAAVIDLLRRRHRDRLAKVAIGALLSALPILLLAATIPGATWAFSADPVRIFEQQFPLTNTDAEVLAAQVERSPTRDARRLAVASWFRLAGRNFGWIVLFPGALFALLALPFGRFEGRRGVLAVVLVLLFVHGLWVGGGGAYGGLSLVAGIPCLIFLLPRRFATPAIPPLVVAAVLWTLPALAGVLLPAAKPWPALRWLPLELTALEAPERLGYRAFDSPRGRWFVPHHALLEVVSEAPLEIRLRGDRRAEIWLVSRADLAAAVLEARALSAGAVLTVAGGDEVHRVRFDSAGKRDGTLLEVPLEARSRDLRVAFGRERFYRLDVVIEGGKVIPGGRFLGATLTLEARSRRELQR
ncbi:MAG: hypothetical protein AAF604_21440 [Acidobacteriota bacterium]